MIWTETKVPKHQKERAKKASSNVLKTKNASVLSTCSLKNLSTG
jgi:hypothetical protein